MVKMLHPSQRNIKSKCEMFTARLSSAETRSRSTTAASLQEKNERLIKKTVQTNSSYLHNKNSGWELTGFANRNQFNVTAAATGPAE